MIWVILVLTAIAFMGWLCCKASGDADEVNEDYLRRYKDKFDKMN